MNDWDHTILQNNRGMALLLAVTIVSLLVAVTLEFNKNMRQELVSSATVKENSQLGAMIKSGYNLVEAVLLKDAKDNTFDSLYDGWAKLATSDLSAVFGRGALELSVDDLAGKLQLNSLGDKNEGGKNSRELLKVLLLSGDFGDLNVAEADLIVAAITDWVDGNDEEAGIEETENSYYLSLDPSYSCKNGPLEYLEELLLVRGITRELYYGSAETKGLRALVTAHGYDGKININSAPAEILGAMEGMTDELAQKMVSHREDEDNEQSLKNVGWYKNIKPWPEDVQLEPKMITTKSRFFGITARARYGELSRTLYAVVDRSSADTIDLVTRKVE